VASLSKCVVKNGGPADGAPPSVLAKNLFVCVLRFFAAGGGPPRLLPILHKNRTGMAEATVEGLAFPSRPSRVSGSFGRRGCMSGREDMGRTDEDEDNFPRGILRGSEFRRRREGR
jgi:hypothetical protein